VHRLYTPAAVTAREMSAADFAAARELAAWRRKVTAAWPAVRVVHVEAAGAGDTPELGATLHLRAEVLLGGLAPDDVMVESCHGRVDEVDQLHNPQCTEMDVVGEADGTYRFEGFIPLKRAGAFGYTVRILPRHRLLSSSAELGLVATA
jgi:starch phosphorylase